MTDNLEKQFFDTFEIKEKYVSHYDELYPDFKHYTMEYPQITDRILLELFDILRKYYNLDFWTIDNSFVMDMRDKQASYTNIIYRTGGDFKSSILSSLNLIVNDKLIGNDNIKQQVQALFKEIEQ